MKSYHSSYTAALTGQTNDRAGWLVSIGYNSSSTFYFASYDCNITGAGPAIGCIVDVSGIRSSIDLQSSQWEHSKVTITLSNGKVGGSVSSSLSDKSLSGLFVQNQIRGRDVMIWKINSSLTTVTHHDPEFVGNVYDVIESIDGASISIVCDSWPEKYRKILPLTVIREADYPNAPKSSFGQYLPIVYGVFQNIASGGYERDYMINNFSLAPSVCIDASIGKFAFAHHAVSDVPDDRIAIYDRSLNTYIVGVYEHTSGGGGITRPTVSSSAPASVSLTPHSTFIYWSADGIYLIPTVKGSKDDDKTTNRQELYNQTMYDGYATLTSTGSNQFCTQRFMSLSAQIEFWKTALSTDNVLYLHVNNTTGSPTYRLVVWNPITGAGDESSGSVSGVGYQSLNFGTFGDRSETDGTGIVSTYKWTIEEISRYEFGIKIETSPDTIEIDSICVFVGKPIISSGTFLPYQYRERNRNPIEEGHGAYNPAIILPYDDTYPRRKITNANDVQSVIASSAIYGEVSGRVFGSWIDDIGRSNTKNSGDVIEESCFQIESILRDELGFGDSSITTSDFDSAERSVSDTTFSVFRPIDSYDLINDLSFSTNSITFPNSSGLWRHIRITQDPEGDATYDFDFDFGADIIPVSFYTTSLKDVCNKLSVKYHFDYGSAQYTKEYEVEDSGSQGTGINGYDHEFHKEISLPYVRFNSDSGATNFAQTQAQIYLALWKNTHSVFEFNVVNHSKMSVEEGDICIFSNVSRNVGSIGAGTSSNYWSSIYSPGSIYWIVIGREPSLDGVKITAMNLHQLV